MTATATPSTSERARASYEKETAEHQMSVLHDDGVYRHIRFLRPGTSIYHFDLVTWPGHLAITGDAGDFVFVRTRDMFEFFTAGGGGDINPGYWAEKLVAPRPDAALSYSEGVFRQLVREWMADQEPDVATAAREQLLEAEAFSKQEAHQLLSGFEHKGVRIDDAWEWDLREFDYRFLWCCWAIRDGIARYRAAQPA